MERHSRAAREAAAAVAVGKDSEQWKAEIDWEVAAGTAGPSSCPGHWDPAVPCRERGTSKDPFRVN